MTATKKRTVTSKAKKKPIAKKQSAKKTTAKTITRQLSFRPCADTVPFFTFQVGRQTVYWLILCGVVLSLGLWIVHLQVEIEHIYDTIELSTLTLK